MSDVKAGDGIVFMKVGVHARETLEDIVKRKQDEFAKAGKIFWGYGGNTCHPTKHIQPFAKELIQQGKQIRMVMHEMNSKHFAAPELAKEYSDDGVSWYEVPNGIEVRGSRYGMVIGGISEEDFDFNLREALVAIGPSRGRSADQYIRARVDKGCFNIVKQGGPEFPVETKHIDLSANLLPPYAVFLR